MGEFDTHNVSSELVLTFFKLFLLLQKSRECGSEAEKESFRWKSPSRHMGLLERRDIGMQRSNAEQMKIQQQQEREGLLSLSPPLPSLLS